MKLVNLKKIEFLEPKKLLQIWPKNQQLNSTPVESSALCTNTAPCMKKTTHEWHINPET